MNLHWISLTPRLQKGIELINTINPTKFNLLLSHINQANGEEIFTEIELNKLKESLKLNDNSLQLLLQSIEHIIKQANKVILKPTVLQKQLVDHLKFNEENAEKLVKAWSETTKRDFGDFDSRMKLENLTWELNLQTASSFCNKQAIPMARLQFDLKAISSDKQETALLELDEEELTHFYNTLETIQVKLDNINQAS